jgi:hypothetical protein
MFQFLKIGSMLSKCNLQTKKIMKVDPIHSKRRSAAVHHNNNKCAERKYIELVDIKKGTGGLPLCSQCKSLNAIEMKTTKSTL